MKKIILFSLMGVTALGGVAAERSNAEMLRIAGENLQVLMPEMKADRKVTCLLEKPMLGVYGVEDGGYVVLGRSSLTPALLGYSARPFDAERIPDGLRWWLETADLHLQAAEGTGEVFRAPEQAVAPMLTTQWAQESPYNRLCPSTGGFWGSSTMTGCVATAMAQVLNYFKYPAASTGMASYSADGGNSFSDVKLSTTFKWDLMRDRYNLGYTDDQANAVAELMRDCGYAAKMVYTAQGSGANLYEAGQGMVNNMQYDPLSMRVRTRAYHTDAEWISMIENELTSGRPILYTGVDTEKMGHSFVFDGLDTRGFVHVNWGWSGDANGYFDISVVSGLTPSYMDPYSGGTISYNFASEQLMVIGIKPQATPDEGEEYESFFASYEAPKMTIENDNLKFSSTPVFNFTHQDFKGLLGLVIQGEDDHAVVLPFFYSAWEEGAEIPVIGGIYISEEFYANGTLNETDMKTPRPDGKYKIYFVSWAEEEMAQGTDPRYIRYPMEFARDGKTNYAMWEAEIRNGHWDPASLKEYTPSGVGEVTDNDAESEGPVRVYGLDGRLLHEGYDTFARERGGQPVIVRRGNAAGKVMM